MWNDEWDDSRCDCNKDYSMKEKIKKLTKYLNYTIEYNLHRIYYQSVKEYFEEHNYDDDEIVEKEKAIENNVLYEVRVYPKTPRGFIRVAGYDIDKVLDKVISNL